MTVSDSSLINATPPSPLDLVLQQQHVQHIGKAFPNAHTPSLQNVYELQCDCDNTDLERQLLGVNGVKEPIAIPEPQLLDAPNDYNMVFQTDYALDLINARGAWDITHGDPSVILGITDENFDTTHEELAGKIVAGGSTGGTLTVYHGTAVAVTAAGNTNNGVGKSSIGYDCSLVLYTCNYNSLLLARDNGARVVNASWHDGICNVNPYSQQVIDELYNDGVTVVAAAGNGGVTCGSASGVAYPAAYDHVISVTSIGPNDNHERFANDPTSAHQHNMYVDISAPGYDVPLTVSAGWYLTGNGSSFAAPFVTGTVGLMLSVNPDLTPGEIKEILEKTAVNIDSLNPGYEGLIGAGRLNAEVAVAMALFYKERESAYEEQLYIEPQSAVGIEEMQPSFAAIWPNPSAGEVTIAYPFSAGQSLAITDMSGRPEQSVSIEASVEKIVPEKLSAGVYYVTLQDKGRVLFRQKIVVV